MFVLLFSLFCVPIIDFGVLFFLFLCLLAIQYFIELQNMGEEGGTDILLSSGISYPLREMDKFRALVEKHAALLNSVDPDNRKKGFEMVNDEGRECGWHVQDDASRVDDELSTLWKQLTEYARSINLASLDDEEDDDGGMEHKLYGQIVEYFKSGKIPYENYGKNTESIESQWQKKCSAYTLADDGLSLKKGTAYVLKRGEVMNVLYKWHRIFGHSRAEETIMFLWIHRRSGCEFERVCISDAANGGRNITFSTGSLTQEGPVVQISKTALSFTEPAYREELRNTRSSNKSQFRLADDGKTLLTHSGAIVLKNDEALNVCMRIHEMCGHPRKEEMKKLLPPFVFISRKQSLTSMLAKKCNFCRCRANTSNIVAQSPVNLQNVMLYIKVHYDEGAAERRFEISTSGVDPTVVDNYVKSSIETLKKFGKWREPMFSPSATLARSVLRVVDLLRGSQKEEIENVIEFDPIQNDTVSMQEVSEKDLMEECDAQSEPESVVVSLVDGEMSGEEEEKIIDEEREESDVDDEELIQMRLQLEESERQAEDMENNASILADSTGRMRAYIRQWEFSDYLREQIRLDENPQERARMEADKENEGRDAMELSEESEEEGEKMEDAENIDEMEKKEEGKESDKENSAEHEVTPGISGVGQSEEDKKRAANRKKRAGKKKRKEEKKKDALEKPPFDLTPYRANYEEKKDPQPDVENTMQMEAVEREKREKQPSPFHPIPLNREGHPARKRGRLAQLRREKEALERNTKKEEEKKVLPLCNPYAAIFGGNLWPEEQMEKIRRMREERERRKEAGLTESEEDDEYDEE